MRDWFKWLWCALRDHPYPKISVPHDGDDDPLLWAPPYCSNCGATIETPTRGMKS